MKLLRIIADFRRLGYENFALRFTEIIQALIANLIVFNNLEYTQTELETLASHIVTKTNKAKTGTKVDRESRNDQRVLCTAVLYRLIYAVVQRAGQEATLDAQRAIVALSTFILAKTDPTPAPAVTQAQGLKGSWIGGNDVTVEWEKAEGALFYRIQTTTTPPSDPNCVWKDAENTSHKSVVLHDQPSLSRVYVRVISYGKNATTAAPSDPIMLGIG